MFRKTYSTTLKFSDELSFTFRFQQGTLRELLEFHEYVKQNLADDWLWEFLNEKCEQTVTFGPKKQTWNKPKPPDKMTVGQFNCLPKKTLENVIDFILKTFGKGFFKKGEERGKRVTAPIESMFVSVFQETNETMESVLNMTWEQFLFIHDGLIYNLNERTEEGRRRNKMNNRMKEMNAEMSVEEARNQALEMEKRIAEKRKAKLLKQQHGT